MGAPTARKLLQGGNPVFTGYREYLEFLANLRDFYNSLGDSPGLEDFRIGPGGLVQFSSPEGGIHPRGRKVFYIHSPLPLDSRAWSLPYDGVFYTLMGSSFLLPYRGVLLKGTPWEGEVLYEGLPPGEALLLMGMTYNTFHSIDNFILGKDFEEVKAYFPDLPFKENKRVGPLLANWKVRRYQKKLNVSLEKQYNRVRYFLKKEL